MYGDFSRLLFHPDRPQKHYSSVLLQQGRVQLDSDANEHAAILLHYLRTLATDIIGPYGGPTNDSGFATGVQLDSSNKLVDLTLDKGRYYVDGLLVENDADLSYFTQPDAYLTSADDPLPATLPFLVYLRVFERLITAVEDPTIREIALGDNGPDTATRTKIVWQVEAMQLTEQAGKDLRDMLQNGPSKARDDVLRNYWPLWKTTLLTESGWLKARSNQPPNATGDPCVIVPDATYRGTENQLYRIEVHLGGTAGEATFKWSRDNGSKTYPIVALEGSDVTVASLGRDTTSGLEAGDWVEIIDDRSALRNRWEPLQQVTEVNPLKLQVTLNSPPTDGIGQDPNLHPLLRRWDQKNDALPIADTTSGHPPWLDLEDGIQIQFQPGATYQRGDFWLIPARTATGDIEGGADPRPPDGVSYHVAPLALIYTDQQQSTQALDLRCSFTRLACPPSTT